MKTIYFCGQDNFGNRGCEALIRANIKTIRSVIPDSHFIIPSNNPKQDSDQWRQFDQTGVEFIPAEPMPSVIRWWSRAKRLINKISYLRPKFAPTATTLNAIKKSDMLVMTGGDIITLDYGLESLYFWMRICEIAMEANKPTILWGASVGPFSKLPEVEKLMVPFLRRFNLITVRETASFNYLKNLGLTNVELVTDSAFVLDVESLPDLAIPILNSDKPILGFNVSPVIRNFRESPESKEALDVEVVNFLADTLKSGEFSVLLIPHVDPLSGTSQNSDTAYMNGLLAKLNSLGFDKNKIDILPRNLNTGQLKAAIAKCSYFIGGRTHATIAALSQTVPTTSIAYSVKAKGINLDLFGHTKYVLETPSVTAQTLKNHFQLLQSEKDEIISHLKDRLPEWKKLAYVSAERAKDILFNKTI